jgi:hypothetical protein
MPHLDRRLPIALLCPYLSTLVFEKYPVDVTFSNIILSSFKFSRFSVPGVDPKIMVRLSLQQDLKAHRVVRRRGYHILSRQSAQRWR